MVSRRNKRYAVSILLVLLLSATVVNAVELQWCMVFRDNIVHKEGAFSGVQDWEGMKVSAQLYPVYGNPDDYRVHLTSLEFIDVDFSSFRDWGNNRFEYIPESLPEEPYWNWEGRTYTFKVFEESSGDLIDTADWTVPEGSVTYSVPIPSQVSFSGDLLNPTISWEATLTPPAEWYYKIRVYELNPDGSFNYQVIGYQTPGFITTTYTLSDYTLEYGKSYAIGVQSRIRYPEGGWFVNRSQYYVRYDVPALAPEQVEIGFMHVQRRKIEDGREFNRLGFSMRLLYGGYPENNILTDVKLYDPNNNEVVLFNPGFQYYKTGYGRYDETTEEWLYPNLFDENYYRYEIQTNDLVSGTYCLRVTDIYGAIHEKYYPFNSQLDLPIISAGTFSWYSDESRNFVLKWAVPDLSGFDPPPNTSVRAIIRIFNDQTFIGDFGMKVPTGLGYLPLPRDVLQMLQSFGNRLEFMVQLRTNDNNNRTYSNRIPLPPHYIDFWYAQHRLYEDGRDFNHLFFKLNDVFGNPIPVETAINPDSPVVLYDENEIIVPIINGKFYTGNRAYGFYDGVNSNFSNFKYESGYRAKINAPLTADSRYRLAITDLNNQTLEGFYRFNGLVDLPVIPVSSFQTQFDGELGDFIWQWQHPGPIPDTSFRAMISVFNGESYVGDHFIRIPSNLSQLIMPTSFLDAGDRLKLRIELRTNDINNRTYSNLLTIPRIDADQDGIADSIDTDPAAQSDNFNDGTTFGTIIDRGDQTLAITDAADPDGVLISASGGTIPAQFEICDDAAGQFSLDAGDELLVTCGSVIVKVISGTVAITFVATDGTIATTDLGAGSQLTFNPATFEITAPDTNTDTVIIVVDGDEISIEPGGSKIIVEIDIKPGSETNCFNQNGHGVLPVAILGSPLLNVEDIDIESLSLQGLTVKMTGKSNKLLARSEYVNDDPYPDLMVQFEDSDSWVDIGTGSVLLNGKMLDGRYIEGSDGICIIE